MDKSKKTAKTRTKPSKPVRDLLSQYKIKGTVIDYGCGRGIDMLYLREVHSMSVQGYDKHYNPMLPIGDVDTVLCTYVLNVIDNKQERIDVIKHIYSLLKKGGRAIITTRTQYEVDYIANTGNWLVFNDGYKTKSGTFQKGYNVIDLFYFVENAMKSTGLNDFDITINSSANRSARYSQIILYKSKEML